MLSERGRRAGPASLVNFPRVARIDLLLLLMTVIWGTNYAIVKHAFREMDPQAFNAVRMIVASSVFVLMMLVMRRAAGRGPTASWRDVFYTPHVMTRRELLALAALGVALEFAQALTSYRHFAVLDMRDDAIGVIAGWACALSPLGRILPAVDRALARK